MSNYNFIDKENPSGCWSFQSHDVRVEHRLHEILDRQECDPTLVSLNVNTKNWEVISSFKRLEEVHLFSPSREQIELVSGLAGIKRLSIESCRPKDIEFLSRMTGLEELDFDAVSGFHDLEPIQYLPKIHALNLSMLRRVDDYSPLSELPNLEFLRISGNFDFQQPIRDLDFLRGLESLEYLIFENVRIIEKVNPAYPMGHMKSLKYIEMPRNMFPLESFGLIAEALKGVEGAELEPVLKDISFFRGNMGWKKQVPWTVLDDMIDHIDMRRPLAPPMQTHNGVKLAFDEFTDLGVPSSEECNLNLLGRGSRGFSSTVKNADKRCLAHIEKYNLARERAREVLTSSKKL